jgi:hypothetical protein
VDVSGNDRYQAGAFAQGYGYWFGIGLVFDGAGDDTYESVYYSLASGAHYSVAAVLDEGGDDVYRQVETIPDSRAGAGVAFAWDFVNALIYDRSGNDTYESNVNCLGRSAQKGNALLIDGAGDDTYIGGANAEGRSRADCLGSSDWQDYYGADLYRTYNTGYESGHLSLLLDTGGADTYLGKHFASGTTFPHDRAADGATWLNPDPDAVSRLGMPFRSVAVFGLGVDRPDGLVPEFHRIPARTPPGAAAPFGADLVDVLDRGPALPVPPAPAAR